MPLDAVRTDKPAPYVQAVQMAAWPCPVTGARAVVNGQTLVAMDGVPAGHRWWWRGQHGELLREGTAVAALTDAQVAAPPKAPRPRLPLPLRTHVTERADGMWFTQVSLKNPVFATMVMLAIVVLGPVFLPTPSRSISFPTSTSR